MSSEVQIAVIDQQDTQIVLAVPGVQGATGSEIAAGGTANQVLRKASGTDYATDWSLVTSAMIEDGAIVDADVNASAAIAGTKISPNFGSQAVVTTGTSTAASFIPTSNTAPTNGLYLPAANNVAISTNGQPQLLIDNNGKFYVGGSQTAFTAGPGNSLSKWVTLQSQDATTTQGFWLLNQDATFRRRGSFAIDPVNNTVGIYTQCSNGDVPAITFTQATTERLRITSTGELKHIGGGSEGSPGVYFAGSAPSNSLYVQATTGNVGLGTSSPGSYSYSDLVVAGSTGGMSIVTGTSGTGRLVFADGVAGVGAYRGAIQYDHANERLELAANGSASVYLNSTGLGIGTTSPGNKLTVIDRTTPIALRVGENDNATTEAGLRIQARNTANTTAYSLDISVDADEAAATFDFGGEERARITSDGKLLVGTSSATGNATTEIKGGTLSTTAATNKGGMLRVQSGAGNMSTASSITISDYFSIAPRRVMGVVYATTVDTSGHRTRSWKVYGKIGALSIVDDVNDSSSGGGSTPDLVLAESASGVLTITPSWTFGGAGYVWSVDLLVGCAAS
jgi:hypothetical protein